MILLDLPPTGTLKTLGVILGENLDTSESKLLMEPESVDVKTNPLPLPLEFFKILRKIVEKI